jgi:hypothetical protein
MVEADVVAAPGVNGFISNVCRFFARFDDVVFHWN